MQEIYEDGHTALLDDERAKDLTSLHRLEDEAVAEVVKRQVDIGLDVVTDGEFRRMAYMNSAFDALGGVAQSPKPLVFHDSEGGTAEFGGSPVVTERLRKVGSPASQEAGYLTSITTHPFKVTFPAASWFHMPFGYFTPGISDRAYDSQDEAVKETVAIMRELVMETIEAGAAYIQFDAPPYAHLCDEKFRAMLPQAGTTAEKLLEQSLETDRAMVEGFPEHVTVAMHHCHGNFKSRWVTEGPFERVAEQVFGLPYQVHLVEWDEPERQGDLLRSLRYVPADTIVVMGIVSSKRPEMESQDELLRHMDDAAKHLDVDQLAISPQCGFASALPGNDVDEDTQWRKLETVVAVADKIWERV